MRDWIRHHPWRLEVVPLAIFCLAAVLPVVYWETMVAVAPQTVGLTAEGAWIFRYVVRLLMVLGLWVGEIRTNYDWVRSEREKRYNLWTFVMTLWMSAAGWFTCQWLFEEVWILVLLLVVPVQALIEQSRPYVPWPEPVDTIPDVKPGETFYYREVFSLWPLVGVYMFVAFTALAGAWSGTSAAQTDPWKFLALSLTVFAISILKTQMPSAITISSRRIAARLAWRRLSISMEHVRNCGVYDFRPLTETGRDKGGWETYDGMLLFIPGGRPGPALKLETTDGKVYLLGVKRPEALCRLIESALRTHDGSQV